MTIEVSRSMKGTGRAVEDITRGLTGLFKFGYYFPTLMGKFVLDMPFVSWPYAAIKAGYAKIKHGADFTDTFDQALTNYYQTIPSKNFRLGPIEIPFALFAGLETIAVALLR